MSEPIVIPLSVFQRQQFAALDAQEADAKAKRSQMATVLIAGAYDPASLSTYAIEVTAESIVCTPRE